MSVVIRLSRGGAKKAAFFRVVVADSRKKRDGRFIEQLGTYNPVRDEEGVRIEAERLNHWVAQGAKPSTAVRNLLRRAGISTTGAATAEAPSEGEEVAAAAAE